MRLLAFLMPFCIPLIFRVISKRHIYWSGLIVPILALLLSWDDFMYYEGRMLTIIYCVYAGLATIGTSTILISKRVEGFCAKIIGFFTKRNHRGV